MARAHYGGGTADFIATVGPGGTLRVAPGVLTFWDAPAGGTQHTDLLVAGAPATAVTVGRDGQVPRFQGPDDIATMWADAGGGKRVLVLSDKTGAELASDSFIASQINTLGSDSQAAVAARVGDSVQPAVEALVPGEVADAVDGHVPGSSLAYLEQNTSTVSTKIAPDAEPMWGLLATVEGSGRPVEIEVYLPVVYHAETAGAAALVVLFYLRAGVFMGYLQMAETRSPVTTSGGPCVVKRQIVLDDGVEYTFYPAITMTVAGSAVALGNVAYQHPYISIVSR